ncbi:MAG: nucleotidyltransferase domain-containing protein [bacterium]|nr:nucleotidyltransferase domain-containing protein [bacterium]
MHIQQKQKKEIERIVKNRGLKFAVVFGSRANGKAKENSDLDIGILDEKEETYRRFGCLFSDFSKTLKTKN